MKKKTLLIITTVLILMLTVSAATFATESEYDTTTQVTPSAPSAFSDNIPGSWYYYYVNFAAGNSIFGGYPDKTFMPNNAMTRAEVATVLYNMEGRPANSYSDKFSDVSNADWFAAPVLWAADNGIVNGYDDNTFKANNQITRQEFVVMLYRYANFKEYNVTKTTELNFPDANEVADWAKKEMQWALACGIINGSNINGTSYLVPGDPTTRAQVAKMLTEFTIDYKENAGKTESVIFNFDNYNLHIGQTLNIDPYCIPESGYFVMTWTSSNPEVASVDANGNVTAHTNGTTTITCTTFDGNSDTCNVIVSGTPIDIFNKFLMEQGEVLLPKYGTGVADEYSEEGWTYRYGVTTIDGGTYIQSHGSSDDGLIRYEIIVDITPLKECNLKMYVYDLEYGITWSGYAPINEERFTQSSWISFELFNCTVPEYADAMKADMLEIGANDLKLMLPYLAEVLEESGSGATLSSFGFTAFTY